MPCQRDQVPEDTESRKGNNNTKRRRGRPANQALTRAIAKKLLRKPRYAVKKGITATNTHCFARNRTDWINLIHNVSSVSSAVPSLEQYAPFCAKLPSIGATLGLGLGLGLGRWL